MMEKELIIGIDTGKNTGLAIWCQTDKNFIGIYCLMIHQAMQVIIKYQDNIKLVRVEDARLRTYFTGGKEKAQGAGSIKRDGKIWEDFLTDNQIPFELVAPKNNRTKLNATQFKKITGWNKSTNQHARDAAMLVLNWNK
jgi:hypothetical protein